MPIPSDLYERISQLVAENRVNSAIELLEAQLPALQKDNPEQYHAALVLMQDFNEIQERKINGLLVAETETNSFSFRLLEFSRVLGRKFNSPLPPPPPAASPDPLRVAQPSYSVPPPQPATSPVNAKPVGKSTSGAGSGGMTLGKLVMYGLAGLGALVVFFIIMELDNEPSEPFDVVDDSVPVVEDPINDNPISMDNLANLLGDSYWISSDVEETTLSFSADGTSAYEDYFLGGQMVIDGAQDGYYHAILTEDGSEFPSMEAEIDISDNFTRLQLVVFERGAEESNGSLTFYRSN